MELCKNEKAPQGAATPESGNSKKSSKRLRVFSMLLMLGTLRVKAFPKIMAILEQVIRSNDGNGLTEPLVRHLDAYLRKLSVGMRSVSSQTLSHASIVRCRR